MSSPRTSLESLQGFGLRRPNLAVLSALCCVLLSGCGFQLRGISSFPFDTLYIAANGPVAVELKRNLRSASTTRLAARNDAVNASLSHAFLPDANAT